MSVNQLLKAIQKQREEGNKREKFVGTFTEYIQLLEKHPELSEFFLYSSQEFLSQTSKRL